VRIVWKNLPLSFHQNAMPAALAAMAAHDQGKYWEFHDKLFANQKNLTRDDFIKYAKELKLDVPKFTAALDSPKNKEKIQADAAEAAKLGVTGTPAFFINGRFLNGAKPFAAFAELINQELQKQGKPIPPGAQTAQPAG
jgi:protein-disulfide isomerase